MARAWQAGWWALRFLTRLPLPRRAAPDADVQARSVLFYPLVGLVIGALLAALGAVLASADAGVGAALLLAVWVGITGALHLDGVADTADAWLGSHGDRQRALEIMKDPRSGAAGVTAVGLILILKFAALGALLAEHAWLALWFAPLLGRAAIVLMLLRLPYLRPDGLGALLAARLPRPAAWWVLFAVGAGVVVFGYAGSSLLLAAVLIAGAFIVWLRRWLGGCTGDTLGAGCELVETAVLIAAVLA
jgi:adenosylcobinamide-GDP ribazoletransferase